LALLAIVGAFGWCFVRPYLEVRAALNRIAENGEGHAEEVGRLGGPEAAAAKCAWYAGLPGGLAAREDRNRAIAVLGVCGPPAFPRLVGLLGSRDAQVRATATEVLGEQGDPRAAEPLVAMLSDPDAVVRGNAADALGRCRDPRAAELLILALRGAAAEVRSLAAYALGELKDPRAAEPLIAALGDPEAGVRFWAAEALGRLRDPRALEPLSAALRDPEAGVRRAAASALGEFRDPRAVEPLIAALKDPDADVRRRAAGALGELGDTRAVDPLKARLADPDSDVRAAVAEALKKIEAAPERGLTEKQMQAARRVLQLVPPDWHGKIQRTDATMEKYFWEGKGPGICLFMQAKDKTYRDYVLNWERTDKCFITLWIMPGSFDGKPTAVQPVSIEPPGRLGRNRDCEVYFYSGGLDSSWPDALTQIREALSLEKE
jgi:HEAT repeat protein